MDIDRFFTGKAQSRQLFDALQQTLKRIGPYELRVSKSQIAFHRQKAFAWVWMPGQYLRGNLAPLVLTLSFSHPDASPRWKEIVEPYPGRFTHHLELNSVADIDDQVRDWLKRAWENAG